jgi:hypothetical protein
VQDEAEPTTDVPAPAANLPVGGGGGRFGIVLVLLSMAAMSVGSTAPEEVYQGKGWGLKFTGEALLPEKGGRIIAQAGSNATEKGLYTSLGMDPKAHESGAIVQKGTPIDITDDLQKRYRGKLFDFRGDCVNYALRLTGARSVTSGSIESVWENGTVVAKPNVGDIVGMNLRGPQGHVGVFIGGGGPGGQGYVLQISANPAMQRPFLEPYHAKGWEFVSRTGEGGR